MWDLLDFFLIFRHIFRLIVHVAFGHSLLLWLGLRWFLFVLCRFFTSLLLVLQIFVLLRVAILRLLLRLFVNGALEEVSDLILAFLLVALFFLN